jgi:hypothetical protein
MGLTSQERETIREEETARWLVRVELKRKTQPRLLLIAAARALSVTALAALFT